MGSQVIHQRQEAIVLVLVLQGPVLVEAADQHLLDLEEFVIELPQAVDQQIQSQTIAGAHVHPATRPHPLILGRGDGVHQGRLCP